MQIEIAIILSFAINVWGQYDSKLCIGEKSMSLKDLEKCMSGCKEKLDVKCVWKCLTETNSEIMKNPLKEISKFSTEPGASLSGSAGTSLENSDSYKKSMELIDTGSKKKVSGNEKTSQINPSSGSNIETENNKNQLTLNDEKKQEEKEISTQFEAKDKIVTGKTDQEDLPLCPSEDLNNIIKPESVSSESASTVEGKNVSNDKLGKNYDGITEKDSKFNYTGEFESKLRQNLYTIPKKAYNLIPYESSSDKNDEKQSQLILNAKILSENDVARFLPDTFKDDLFMVHYFILIAKWYELKYQVKNPITNVIFSDGKENFTYPIFNSINWDMKNVHILDTDNLTQTKTIAALTNEADLSDSEYGEQVIKNIKEIFELLKLEPANDFTKICTKGKEKECGKQVWNYVLSNCRYQSLYSENLAKGFYEHSKTFNTPLAEISEEYH